VLVLEPAPGLLRGERLWAPWGAGKDEAAWSADGKSAAAPWESVAESPQVRVPLPPRATSLAVGVRGPGQEPAVTALAVDAAVVVPSLALQVEAAEPWWVRLRPTLPPEVREARVWVGEIPYPVVLQRGRPLDVAVALLPGENRAYLEAVDARGQVQVGPEIELPAARGEPPTLVAVVVWEGDGVDLDLHGWIGGRHTYPQDPDPAFSPRAAPGTKLLFDGDADGRASALAAWNAEDLELEVWCYSDLNGRGTRAWLYWLEHPGDPITSRRRVFGPRRLSDASLSLRWPISARLSPSSFP